jgi:transcriptional regulator with XRE-family HTH domain
MTPEEFRARRDQLGWSQTELARALGVSHSAVYRYEAGTRRIAEPVARLLDILVVLYTAPASQEDEHHP